MKLPIKSIAHKIIPMISVISEMQARGMLQVPFKVSFALGKNLSTANVIKKEFDDFQNKLLKENCELDKNGVPLMVESPSVNGQPPKQNFKFKTPETEEKLNTLLVAENDREVEIEIYKISLSELEKVNNMPANYIAYMDECGMLNESGIDVVNRPTLKISK